MLPWIRTSKDLVLATHLFRIFRAGFRSPASGKEGIFDVAEAKDWVNVIAVDANGAALLVRQFRFGSGEVTLEFPAGGVEAGQSPLETAKRELAEELGATGEEWHALGSCRPNPAYLNNRCHHFFVRGAAITQGTRFDENEEIELVRVPLTEIDALIADGTISHALAIVAWHQFQAWRARRG